MKFVDLDFEYFNSCEPIMDVVCCATRDYAGVKRCYWVFENDSQKAEFVAAVKKWHSEGAVFRSYNVIAEARAIHSLGMDPTEFKWVDLALEWKQLRNGNFKRLYGKYICPRSGNPKMSYPPPIDEFGKAIPKADIPKERRKNNSQTGTSLLSCIYNLLDVHFDQTASMYKDGMRNRILRGGPFPDADKKAISEYALSDIEYLPAISDVMRKEICELSGASEELYYRRAFVRGEWAARLALIEAAGIPVNVSWLKNIGKNYPAIRNQLIETLVQDVYPFYEMDKTKKDWVEKRTAFAGFIEKIGAKGWWPKTKAGQYSTAKETLEDNEDIPEILEYRRVREAIGQIRAFREADRFVDAVPHGEEEDDSPNSEGRENIYQRIGSDNRLRSFFNPYGTQTSRNAPPARNFILAMSAWLRSCIQPPEGYAITGIDYSSEEFIIAACEASDHAMAKAYDSGDPYIWLAKTAGAIPPNGTKKTHPVVRNEFKCTCLGLQFSMGIKKLQRSLSRSTGKEVDYEYAKELADIHKDTFHTYWSWNESNIDKYESKVPLRTRDGWFLFCDNPNPRSAGNMPIQGAGGAILRRAVRYAQKAGIVVISPLHDAIYALHRIEDTDKVVSTLRDCMSQAFKDFYNRDIRMDAKTWKYGEIFIEEKGAKYYRALKDKFQNPGDALWMVELGE